MLRDAALLQLRITRQALAADPALKDATPYNVQWVGTRPIFIDVGSFEQARPGEPWLGYRQFCTLFLYPLLLEAHKGTPFPAVTSWLPRGDSAFGSASAASRPRHLSWGSPSPCCPARKTRARVTRAARRTSGANFARPGSISSSSAANLNGLGSSSPGSTLPPQRRSGAVTRRHAATQTTTRTPKRSSYEPRCSVARRTLVWDLGANDGRYSRIAAAGSAYTIALDVGPRRRGTAVSQSPRRECTNILPLVGDVADPSPALGWRESERLTLAERGRPTLFSSSHSFITSIISRTIPMRELVAGSPISDARSSSSSPTATTSWSNGCWLVRGPGSHSDYTRASFVAALQARFTVLGSRVLAVWYADVVSRATPALTGLPSYSWRFLHLVALLGYASASPCSRCFRGIPSFW